MFIRYITAVHTPHNALYAAAFHWDYIQKYPSPKNQRFGRAGRAAGKIDWAACSGVVSSFSRREGLGLRDGLGTVSGILTKIVVAPATDPPPRRMEAIEVLHDSA